LSQVLKPKKGYKLVKGLFGKYEEIPEEWEIEKLKNLLIRGNQGVNTAIDKVEYVDDGIPMLKAGDIKENFELSKTSNISEQSFDAIPEHHKPKKNDILYANIGSALGTAMLVTSDTKIAIAWNVFLMKTKDNQNSRYLVYFLNKYDIWNMLKSRATQSTMPFISKPTLLSLNILLPTFLEQRKIITILSNVDELINSTRKIIDQTILLKKGLMQNLLTRGIGHTKFKRVKGLFEQEIEIPKEWNWGKIEDNSTLKGRIGWQGLTTAEYRQQGEFYLVTGTDFKDGRIDWQNCVYVDEERYVQDSNIQLKKGDVLVTKDGTIGKIAYVDEISIPATLNTGVFVIRPIAKKYSSLFLFYILYSDYFLKFLNRLKAGSTINHLYQKDFIDFHFPIPSLQEQQKITSIMSNIDSQIISQTQYKEKLERLKRSLIQKLLTGEVRVTV